MDGVHGHRTATLRSPSPSTLAEEGLFEASAPDTTFGGTPDFSDLGTASLPQVHKAKGKSIVSKSKVNPRPPEPSWADEESPFERLQQDMRKARLVSTSPSSAASFSMPQAPAIAPSRIAAAAAGGRPQTRLRDLSIDSPDFERPALYTMSFQHPRDKMNRDLSSKSDHPSSQNGRNAQPSYNDNRNHISHPSAFFKEGTDMSSITSQNVSVERSASLNQSPFEGAPSPLIFQPPLSRRQSGGNQLLLQKVLMKNLVRKDGRPNASTPARKSMRGKALPENFPQQWDGIADLSTTPLSSFDSPQKPSPAKSQSRFKAGQSHSRAPHSELAFPSPSSSSIASNAASHDTENSYAGSFGLPQYDPPAFSISKTRLTRTPAKEAARLMTRDVLQRAALRNGGGIGDAGAESPVLDPPSVVKNWATRGYAASTRQTPGPHGQVGKSPVLPLRSALGSLQENGETEIPNDDPEGESFEAEFEPFGGEAELQPPPLNFGHLADKSDEVHQENGGAMEEWGDSFEEYGEGASIDQQGNAGDGFEETEVQLGGGYDDAPAEQSFDESHSMEQETVFGAKAGRPSFAAQGARYGLDPEEALRPDMNDRRSAGFQLRGPGADDMVTLHGGKLLESQPFEASPLAGRDPRYGL